MSNSDTNPSMPSGELLSSFMDGELESSAASFFARRLSQDESLQSDWERWHMVRSVLRDGGTPSADADLVSRISLALEDEAVHQAAASQGGWGERMMKPVASAAIAATVAMTAIIGINQYRATDSDAANGLEGVELAVATEAESTFVPTLPANSSPSVSLPLVPVSLENGPSRQQDPLARARLEAYLLRHYWQLGADGKPSFIGAMPIITGENGEPVSPLLNQQAQASSAVSDEPVVGDDSEPARASQTENQPE